MTLVEYPERSIFASQVSDSLALIIIIGRWERANRALGSRRCERSCKRDIKMMIWKRAHLLGRPLHDLRPQNIRLHNALDDFRLVEKHCGVFKCFDCKRWKSQTMYISNVPRSLGSRRTGNSFLTKENHRSF